MPEADSVTVTINGKAHQITGSRVARMVVMLAECHDAIERKRLCTIEFACRPEQVAMFFSNQVAYSRVNESVMPVKVG